MMSMKMLSIAVVAVLLTGGSVTLASSFDYAKAGRRLEAGQADALREIRPAAKKGDPGALFLLGAAHLHGIGVEQNARLAERYFRESSHLGFMKATATLAIGLMTGERGFRKNQREGLQLAVAAVKSGEPRGLTAVAVAYASGLVRGKTEGDAMALLRQAAQKGDRMAQALLKAVAQAERRPPYQMSAEEAAFWDLDRAGKDKVAAIATKLKAHPDIAHFYYKNVPPHSYCLQYWDKPGIPESWNNSMLICTIHSHYYGRIIRRAQAGIAAAQRNIQVENFRHHLEQSQKTRDWGRTSRDMREGYYGSYRLGGAESQGFPSDARNW